MLEYISLSKSGDDIPTGAFRQSGRHGIVAGASGSGKTAATKIILDHDLDDGRHIVVFDPDDVYRDYAASIGTMRALAEYLSRPPTNKGVRFTSDKAGLLVEGLETIFRWASENDVRSREGAITVAVDEFTVFADQAEGETARRLRAAVRKIAERGRHHGIWGWWVAQGLDALPHQVIHTARLILLGQHKSPEGWKPVKDTIDKSFLRRLPHLHMAEFVAWSPGIQPFVATLTAPARGGYEPVVNAQAVASDSMSAADLYAEICDMDRKLFARVNGCTESFELLAALTGVSDETLAEALAFVGREAANAKSRGAA